MPGRCFVALAFDREDTDTVYDRLIAPVVRRVGMTPVRIDRKEHNRNINEVIVDELKSADLVIADLTYARPSVYFEAGFAERVAPVIYAVRSDHFRPLPDDKDGNLRVHFDLSMRNIIGWSSESDRRFAGRLERRIRHVMAPVWRVRQEDAERKDQVAAYASQPISLRMNMLADVAARHLRSAGYELRPDISRASNHYPGRASSLLAVTGSRRVRQTLEYVTVAVQSRITAQAIRHFFFVSAFTDNRVEARQRAGVLTRRHTVVFAAETGIRMEAVRRELSQGRLEQANELLWEEPSFEWREPGGRSPVTRSWRVVLFERLQAATDLKDRLQSVLPAKKR